MEDTQEPSFEWVDEQPKEPDPLADQKLYFAKWELRRQQRILEERRNSKGLSVYERARQNTARNNR